MAGQRYNAQGVAQGSEFQINATTANQQRDPSVTALADGGFVVTWEANGQDGSGYGVYGQRYNAQGVAQGSEFQINTYTTNNQDDPSVTALADGGFVVTWESNGQDGDGWGIYGQRFSVPPDPTPTAIGSEFQINTHTASTSVATFCDRLSPMAGSSSRGSPSGRTGLINGASTDSATTHKASAQGSEFQINTDNRPVTSSETPL